MGTNVEDAKTESNPETDVPERLETLSYLLDDAIPVPGTHYRIGIDPILGVVPIGGDALGVSVHLSLPRIDDSAWCK